MEGSAIATENQSKQYDKIENIYTKKNIRELINFGHYDSAYDLLEKIEPKNRAIGYLKLAKFQLLNIQTLINQEDDIFIKPRNQRNQFNPSYIKDHSGCEILLEEDIHILNEHFLRAKLHKDKNNISGFIMSFQTGIEFLLLRLICRFNEKDDLRKQTVSAILKENNYVDSNLPNQFKYCVDNLSSLFDNNSIILNLLINVFSSYKEHILNQKAYPDKDKHLDNLRNSIAHNGKTYSKTEVPFFIFDSFEKMYKIIGLPVDYWNKLEDIIIMNLF